MNPKIYVTATTNLTRQAKSWNESDEPVGEDGQKLAFDAKLRKLSRGHPMFRESLVGDWVVANDHYQPGRHSNATTEENTGATE